MNQQQCGWNQPKSRLSQTCWAPKWTLIITIFDSNWFCFAFSMNLCCDWQHLHLRVGWFWVNTSILTISIGLWLGWSHVYRLRQIFGMVGTSQLAKVYHTCNASLCFTAPHSRFSVSVNTWWHWTSSPAAPTVSLFSVSHEATANRDPSWKPRKDGDFL